jgi:hypothetical protein
MIQGRHVREEVDGRRTITTSCWYLQIELSVLRCEECSESLKTPFGARFYAWSSKAMKRDDKGNDWRSLGFVISFTGYKVRRST